MCFLSCGDQGDGRELERRWQSGIRGLPKQSRMGDIRRELPLSTSTSSLRKAYRKGADEGSLSAGPVHRLGGHNILSWSVLLLKILFFSGSQKSCCLAYGPNKSTEFARNCCDSDISVLAFG